MTKHTLILFTGFAIAAGIYVAFKLLKFYNAPDGERYAKRNMQGPFVPLRPEDDAVDEARIANAKSPSQLR